MEKLEKKAVFSLYFTPFSYVFFDSQEGTPNKDNAPPSYLTVRKGHDKDAFSSPRPLSSCSPYWGKGIPISSGCPLKRCAGFPPIPAPLAGDHEASPERCDPARYLFRLRGLMINNGDVIGRLKALLHLRGDHEGSSRVSAWPVIYSACGGS